jgi:hypothetical protein
MDVGEVHVHSVELAGEAPLPLFNVRQDISRPGHHYGGT